LTRYLAKQQLKTELNIPLYTMKSRDASVPIALNYHASGLKVAETASWVGLVGCLTVEG